MSDATLEKSVWDLLLARVLVDPTLVLLSEMDAKICSEWVRLIPDKFCFGVFFSRDATMSSSSPSSTRTLELRRPSVFMLIDCQRCAGCVTHLTRGIRQVVRSSPDWWRGGSVRSPWYVCIAVFSFVERLIELGIPVSGSRTQTVSVSDTVMHDLIPFSCRKGVIQSRMTRKINFSTNKGSCPKGF